MQKSFFNSVKLSEKQSYDCLLPEPVRWAEALDWRCRNQHKGGDRR
ncbi:MAG: hypothetical protein J7L44_03215 [Candidatus Diapherotrites archaeon]|nr:hypothetical protein [Candidatus Diapherotrites archaeon]